MFLKCFKLNVNFRNAVEFSEKIFSLLDNSISIDCGKFSLLTAKYFSSDVNVLTNGPKILDINENKFFGLKFALNDEKVHITTIVKITALFLAV